MTYQELAELFWLNQFPPNGIPLGLDIQNIWIDGGRGEHGDAGGNTIKSNRMTRALHLPLPTPEKPCYARQTATRYLSR